MSIIYGALSKSAGIQTRSNDTEFPLLPGRQRGERPYSANMVASRRLPVAVRKMFSPAEAIASGPLPFS